MMIALSDLQLEEEAIIKSLEMDSSLKERFEDLGFVSGTKVRIVRIAPLGDPLEVRIKGYFLGLRRVDAKKIFVEGLS